MRATDGLPSPELFRRWAAVALISTIISRRVWTSIGIGKKLFGNVFVVLVAAPATGKSLPIDEAQKMLRPFAKNVALCSAEITPERLVQRMGDLFHAAAEEGQWSFGALISEMGTFMPKPDIAFMQRLANLWDCPDFWDKETKKGAEKGGSGQDYLHFPYMTLLAAAQPSWINALITQDMLGLGLPSRVLFVLSEEDIDPVMFTGGEKDDRLARMAPKLEELLGAQGYFPFDADARTVMLKWQRAGYPDASGKPYRSDAYGDAYRKRRKLHVGKLALVYALATHPERMVVEAADVQKAMALIFVTEKGLPKVLAAAGGNPYLMREGDVLAWVRQQYGTGEARRAVPERLIRERLSKSIPTPQVSMVIEEMIARGDITPTGEGVKPPMRMFRPKAAQP